MTDTPPTEASVDDHFLHRWFHVLKNRLLLSDRHSLDAHNVRVETSDTSDWWIQVHPPQYERCFGCGFYATHEMPSRAEQETHLHELREALVLLTAYARLDYDAWLQEMKSTSGLRFRHHDFLNSRFSFVVGKDPSPDGSYPCDLFVDVFGEHLEELSDEFIASYEHLKQCASEMGVPFSSLFAPIPIRLEFSQLSTSTKDKNPTLSSMVDAVYRMQAQNKCDLPSLYVLDCIEMRLHCHELNVATLDAIDRVLDTGVRIGFIELPGTLKEPSDEAQLDESWRSLAHKLFHSENQNIPRVDKAQIVRLELPSIYFTNERFSMTWLPLLTTASNVQSLTINTRPSIYETVASSSTARAWLNLAYAMFSTDTTNVIESLHLNGLDGVYSEIVTSFSAVVGSTTPRQDLLQALRRHPNSPLDSINGVSKHDNHLIHSRRKLRRIVLTSYSRQPTDHDSRRLMDFIMEILQAVGTSLTDLAIEGTHVDQNHLLKFLAQCPKLQSLRLRDASLPSLDLIRTKLSSVDLRSIVTSNEALHEFVKGLQSDNGSILRRLRIGEGWSRYMDSSTPQVLNEMLAANQSLSYLHVFRPNNPYAASPDAVFAPLRSHNGKFISSRDRPLALESKLSFLAARRRSTEQLQFPPLNQDVLTQIFEYAATPCKRTVIIEADPMSYVE